MRSDIRHYCVCGVPHARCEAQSGLRLYTRRRGRVSPEAGRPAIHLRARAVDNEDKGLSSDELQRLLQQFNPDGSNGKTILRGRLRVDGAVPIHQLADKSRAVSQCETCHRAGLHPSRGSLFQSATHPAGPSATMRTRDVLTSVVSVDSVRGFYVIGGTADRPARRAGRPRFAGRHRRTDCASDA